MPLCTDSVVTVGDVNATAFHLVGEITKASTVFQLDIKTLRGIQGCRSINDIKIRTGFIGVARDLQAFVISHGPQFELFAILRNDERNVFDDALALIVHFVKRSTLGHHQGLRQTPVSPQ